MTVAPDKREFDNGPAEALDKSSADVIEDGGFLSLSELVENVDIMKVLLRSLIGMIVAELLADSDDPSRNPDSLFTGSLDEPVNLAAAVDFRRELRSTDASFGIDAGTDAQDAAAVLAVKKVTTEAATALASLSALVVSRFSELLKKRLESSTSGGLVARPSGVSEADSPEGEE